MKRLKQIIAAATRKAETDHAVPLMVPHGGADASSDFESAFEVLQRDERARELWHGERVRVPFGRAP